MSKLEIGRIIFYRFNLEHYFRRGKKFLKSSNKEKSQLDSNIFRQCFNKVRVMYRP